MAENEMFPVVHNMAATLTGQANAIVTEVKNARVDAGKLVHDFRTDAETPYEWIKSEQEWLDLAEQAIADRLAKLDERIKAELVQKSEMDDATFEAKKVEHQALVKGIKSALKMVQDIPGYDAEYYSDLPSLLTFSGAKSTSNTGTRRVRLASLSIDGVDTFVMKKMKDGSEEKSATFTLAAQVIAKAAKTKVSPSDLSNACFEAAKTDDLSKVTNVEYSYSVNGQSFMINVIPAASA